MTNGYLEVISLVERLHRHFLDVVKLELDGLGIHDINNVQALMLFNIGDAEMTVGELTLRGCYLGSNVSYNVKKWSRTVISSRQRSLHDRRSIHVRLTDKGPRVARPARGDASAPCRDAAADRDHRTTICRARPSRCAGSSASGSGGDEAPWCSGRDNSPPRVLPPDRAGFFG